jgi:hypothetical protein
MGQTDPDEGDAHEHYKDTNGGASHATEERSQDSVLHELVTED